MASSRKGKRRRPQSMDIEFINNPPSPNTGFSSPSSHAPAPSPVLLPPVQASQSSHGSQRIPPLAPSGRPPPPPSAPPASSQARSDPQSAPAAGSAVQLPPLPSRSGAGSSSSQAVPAKSGRPKAKRPYVCDICGFSFSQRSDRAKVSYARCATQCWAVPADGFKSFSLTSLAVAFLLT